MDRVWHLIAEAQTTDAAGTPFPTGTLVYILIYVPAEFLRDALQKAESALSDDGYDVVDYTRCVRFELDDWDYEEHPADSEVRIICERLAASGELQYGPVFGPNLAQE